MRLHSVWWVLACAACWGNTAPLATGRYRHTATTLKEADLETQRIVVAVVGGCDRSPVEPGCELATTELFHWDTQAWSPGPSLGRARAGHVAVRLRDHSVLIIGGLGTENGELVTDAIVDAERLFFPQSTGFAPYWRPSGTLAEGRINHTATVLRDGRVLVVGGQRVADEITVVAGAEIWDPATESFTPTDPPATPRAYHTATLLPDGEVLIVGGIGADSDAVASTEIYDPAAAAWRAGPTLPMPLVRHAAAIVGAGPSWRVIVSGGGTTPLTNWTVVADVVAADVTADAEGRAVVSPWAPIGSLTSPRYDHVAALHPTGTLLAIGGVSPVNELLADVDVLAPGAVSWTHGPALPAPRGNHQAANALPGGQVLVTGGFGSPATADLLALCDEQKCTTLIPSCLCPTACPDSDGDGLSDAWETQGIDTDNDGAVDVTLPGADPARRDLYLEIDYLAEEGSACPVGPAGLPGFVPVPGCFKPFQASVDLLENVFATHGYNVHVEVGNAVPYHEWITHGGCLGFADDVGVLPDIKRRNSPAWRRGIYHYALFSDHVCDSFFNPRTGLEIVSEAGSVGEVYGDDLTMGGQQVSPLGGTVQRGPIGQGPPLVHELGHNLGFSHAGPPTAPIDPPNYTSVMGGQFLADPDFDADGDQDADEDGDVDQLDIDLAFARVDFSEGGLGALDENGLRERDGIPGAHLPYAVTFTCPPGVTTAPKARCSGAAGPQRRACTQLVRRGYVREGGVDKVLQTWRVVSRTANEIDWNCDQKIDTKALPPSNVNNTWQYSGEIFDVTSPYPCAVVADCLGGVGCVAGRCQYRSPRVIAPIRDVFPGFVDWDLMNLGFQCYGSADMAGEDQPVFSVE